jgi:GDP-L-fucose synthase
MPINLPQKIFVAGHRGMVGSAILRKLKSMGGYHHIVTRTRSELDLTNQKEVKKFFQKEKPDQVYIAAAKVGGIQANNSFPAEFIYSNLMVEANLIHHAYEIGVKKLIFLGSSCIYPRESNQPMREDALLTGLLEPTNEPYAIAKIAGIKLCESYNRQYGNSHGLDYRSLMPTNLYGPGDNYHPVNSHVIPALIRRFHEAKLKQLSDVSVWGSGRPRREFLFVDDLAAASVHIMNLDSSSYQNETHSMNSHINVGYSEDITIRELAQKIAKVVGFQGGISFDFSKPDGSPQKLIDSSKIKKLGWVPKVNLEIGLNLAYQDFLKFNK